MDRPDIRVATFDCYGTLVDWEGGAAAFLYQLALRHEDPRLERGQVLRDRWETIQFGLLSGRWRPYKQILAQSLEAFCEERGWPFRKKDADAFIRSMRAWQPFPDTRPALLQAKAEGLRLVILSNTDADIMAHTLRQLDLPFDDVITAEDVGAYKPRDAGFEYALARVGEPPEHVLHVAFGFKYDIAPARRHGMRTAWVNRHAEPAPGGGSPDYEWRDLWGLAELMGGRGPALRRPSTEDSGA
ncbi:MAG TPA: haloacid dehalogenase type II [Candidatus Limnocylindrales bacterium]|jgi:2-haloalkanoic acid dehalogenase type II